MATTSDDRVSLAGNRLLAALAPGLGSDVAQEFDEVELTTKQPLYESGMPIADVFFPLDSVVSVVADMADGTLVEVATVGSEGMVGVPVLLRATESDYRAFAQIPGRALRLPAGRLLELVSQNEDFAGLLYRYVQALMTQMARSAACNRTHSVDERAARWLLLTHDRVGRDEFLLTQEFLAQMLGVRRASVNTAASMLQRAATSPMPGGGFAWLTGTASKAPRVSTTASSATSTSVSSRECGGPCSKGRFVGWRHIPSRDRNAQGPGVLKRARARPVLGSLAATVCTAQRTQGVASLERRHGEAGVRRLTRKGPHERRQRPDSATRGVSAPGRRGPG